MQKPDQVYVSYIRSTPEKVWRAITEPEFARQYWCANVNISDWKKGSKWEHVEDGNRAEVYVTGEVLESIPPKRLVLTWADPDAKADQSRVTFEIEPIADMVRLKVIHGDFQPGSDMAAKVAGGWPLVLSSLKTFLETGKGFENWAALKTCGSAA
jgi:uncharacterized protein YndB with AHSA1/START domain